MSKLKRGIRMKKTCLLILLFVTNVTFAQQLEITSWFRPNNSSNQDLAAEVCFSLTPAPQKLTHAVVKVDKTNRGAVIYNTFIGSEGKTCLVVTSVRGTVEVVIPQTKMVVNKSL